MAASVFRAFLDTIPRSSIRRQIGHLPESDWKGVQLSLKIALATL